MSMRWFIMIAIVSTACSSSVSNDKNSTSSEKQVEENMPLTYEELQQQVKGDSAGAAEKQQRELERQWKIYKDIYPSNKLSKRINDFSALDTGQLQRVYLNFSLLVSNYIDSGKGYLPFFREMYGAMDQQMEALEAKQQIEINDKLKIMKIKSQINTSIANIELRSATK